jgi:hypothetical protein
MTATLVGLFLVAPNALTSSLLGAGAMAMSFRIRH